MPRGQGIQVPRCHGAKVPGVPECQGAGSKCAYEKCRFHGTESQIWNSGTTLVPGWRVGV